MASQASSGWPSSAEATASVGRLRTAGDPKDHHDVDRVVDHVDHPQVADPQAPELGSDQLHCARGTRIPPQGKDRSAQSGGVARRQAAQIALPRWGDVDA